MSIIPPNLEKIKSLLKEHKFIKLGEVRNHTKASEIYIDVEFFFPDKKINWIGSIPIEYRRTGVSFETSEEIADYIKKVYLLLNPRNYESWLTEQINFWDKSNKEKTRPFFEGLKDNNWKCVYCELPKNPNFARRIQDLKEFGYTISTNTKMFCKNCKVNTTHLILLQLPRGGITGYETWSPKLRKKIVSTLNEYDVYEDRKNHSLLPDHKFPEIRWDEHTREENDDEMSEDEIKSKFQLLSNQRNQQKREVCRYCYQNNKRGYPYNIKFFYEGDENWPKNVPIKGKNAEKGCIGCGWYDLNRWKKELNKTIVPS